MTRRFLLLTLLAARLLGASAQAKPLDVYQPQIELGQIYSYNPAATPPLRYNHDVDIVKYRGRFFAAWNANQSHGEDVPGQYNFLSVSDDFKRWSKPVKMFTAEGGALNPVQSDNQWQPNFINWHERKLFCAWSDFVARRVFVATSEDGLRWTNTDVPNAPVALKGQVSAFPTNHGLLTSKGVMLFPCSLPMTDTQRAIVGHTRYAAVLRSTDEGKSWSWSEPIQAETWTQAGENPAAFGGDTITIWEPMLFEAADGTIGLLVRNSTAQENPERAEKPERMLLYATSRDGGQTWNRARTVEVDTICSRNYSVAGVGRPDSLLMVMNDNNVRVPERISHDRYFLSLYSSPVSDPDLLLPGPVIQPEGGTAFYPNGFVDHNRLYVAYTYSGGIATSVVSALPEFSRPFLLPRGGRPGLTIAPGFASFGQRQSSLGLVLTEALTHQPTLHLAFDLQLLDYDGTDRTLLTLGGKTRNGTLLRAIYRAELKSNVFELQGDHGQWISLGAFALQAWNHFELTLDDQKVALSVNRGEPRTLHRSVLRKICFGGLYVPPEWPAGVSASHLVRLNLETLNVR